MVSTPRSTETSGSAVKPAWVEPVPPGHCLHRGPVDQEYVSACNVLLLAARMPQAEMAGKSQVKWCCSSSATIAAVCYQPVHATPG